MSLGKEVPSHASTNTGKLISAIFLDEMAAPNTLMRLATGTRYMVLQYLIGRTQNGIVLAEHSQKGLLP